MKDLALRFIERTLFFPMKKKAFASFQKVERLCFINMGGLGDYMLFSPAIKLCRQEYPNAHITLLTLPNFKAVQELFPEIDEAILLPSSDLTFPNLCRIFAEGEFDGLILNQEFAIPSWALSLAIAFSNIPVRVGCARNNLRKAVLTGSAPDQSHQANAYLMDLFYFPTEVFFSLVNNPVKADLMAHYHYKSSVAEQARLLTLLPQSPSPSGTPRIVIHPGSSKNSKDENWSKSWPAASWKRLMEQLIRLYPTGLIYLTGGPDDLDEITGIETALQDSPPEVRARIVNLYGRITSTSSLAELLSEANVFIGCDSFAMHLALYCQTPLVAIFALTNEKRFLPSDNPLCRTAVRRDLPCRPCYPFVRDSSCDTPVCQDVPVSEVLYQVQQHLNPVIIPVDKANIR
jgi:ADP-heptose:LPS heptosyltransferase